MIKIIVDSCSLIHEKTGIGNYLNSLLIEIEKNEKIILILVSNSNIIYNSTNTNTKFIYPKNISKYLFKGPLWLNLFFLYYVLKEKPNFIWGVNGLMPFYFGSSKKILSIHDFTHIYYPKTQKKLSYLYRLFFQKISILISDHILVLSQSTLTDLHKFNNIKNNQKVDIIYPSFNYENDIFNSSQYKKLNSKYSFEKYICTVGTLEPRKNIGLLIEAFNLYKQINSHSDLKLIIIGGNGWKTKFLNFDKDIKFLGYLPESNKNYLITKSIAFIMPSLYEGFGMPVYEAQILGAPVIINNINSLKEASDNIGIVIDMTVENLITTFYKIENNELPLVCRIINDKKFSSQNIVSKLLKFVFI